MKVLFGITNKDTVEGIVKYYKEKFNETLEYDTALYFKDFSNKLARGNYDRAVLAEELEKMPTKNHAEADKLIIDYIERLINDFEGQNLILIMSERRKLGDDFLARLFSMGIYTTLTGSDRTKGKVCNAIKTPVSRKEAKKYYDVNAQQSSFSEVSELEIMRIKAFFRNLNGDTSKYCEIFDRIVPQYTTEQMQIIIRCLPKDVNDFLAQNSESYRNILNTEKVEIPVNTPPPVQQPVAPPETQNNANAVEIKNGNEIADKIVVKEEPKEAPKEVVKEVVKEVPKEVTKEAIKEVPKEEAKVAPKEVVKEVIKEVPKEVVKEVIKEVPKEVVKEVIKEVPKEVVREKVVTQVKEKKIVETRYDVPEDYRKTVCFVGAPKAGTTFCINAIGTYLARNKVKTAIVDMTRKRDMYTIYTYDNTGKRNIAGDSLRYASSGKNEPLVYDKMSIYTAVPGEDRKSYNPNLLVDTISKNNNVVLIDADFSTPLDYFRLASDIYVVQDMNVLNISQITLFLRELKQRGIGMDKIKIVINKYVECSLDTRDIIDGIATYTSYDLKMFDELFNPKRVQYFILPFNVENYKKYIDMVYKYSNKFASFTKDFQENLNQIINTIYPTRGEVTVQEDNYTQESTKNKGGFGLFGKKK